MIRIRRAADRGTTRIGWLDSRHTFSFNRYYDPEQMGFRTLRVINDDLIQPGGKFGRHPHENMEILTWVLRGSVVHEDSTGARGVIRPGDAQKMSAGTGIYHSEANGSETDDLHLLQIWIEPEREGIAPGYEQRHFGGEERRNRMRLIASRDGRDGSIVIHQDVSLYAGSLDQGARASVEVSTGRYAWLQVAAGSVELNGTALSAGDGAAVSDETKLELSAVENAELLLFDLA